MISTYNYDYVLLTSYQGQKILEVIDEIVVRCGIEKECLLTHRVFSIFQNHIERYSNGERYADKKFLLIRNINYISGLGSICDMVITNVSYARQNGYIPIVDLKSCKSQYLEEEKYGTVNAWEKFFFQPDKYTLDDVKEAKNILRVSNGVIWQSCKKQEMPWLPKMKNELEEKYKKYLREIEGKRWLGVLFRGTDYSQQAPYGLPVQPDLDTMINMTRRKMDEWGEFDLIFLCTEVQQACERFEEEFGNKVIFYPQLRFDAEIDVVRLALYSFHVQGERTKRGEDYWIALNILGFCNSIIAGRCCGTEMAMKINCNCYENKYLFDLGRYGISE